MKQLTYEKIQKEFEELYYELLNKPQSVLRIGTLDFLKAKINQVIKECIDKVNSPEDKKKLENYAKMFQM